MMKTNVTMNYSRTEFMFPLIRKYNSLFFNLIIFNVQKLSLRNGLSYPYFKEFYLLLQISRCVAFRVNYGKCIHAPACAYLAVSSETEFRVVEFVLRSFIVPGHAHSEMNCQCFFVSEVDRTNYALQ